MAIGDVKDLFVRFFAENWAPVKEKIDSIPDEKDVKVKFSVDSASAAKISGIAAIMREQRLGGGGSIPGGGDPNSMTGSRLSALASLMREQRLAAGGKGSGGDSGGGGWYGKVLAALGGDANPSGGFGGIVGSLGSIGGGIGWGVLAGGAGALVNEVAALVSGFAAATAGAGAFGLLAKPTFSAVSGAITQISADTLAYQRATTATAKKTDLAHIKADWAALDPAQKQAVKGVQAFQATFGQISAAFEPQTMKIFNEGLSIANHLLPVLTPMATAFANALGPLLVKLDKFVQSKGFQDWMAKFTSLIGPAASAIGNGIGRMVSDLGKLLTIFSGKDVAHAINIAFDTIDAGIRLVTWTINTLRTAWDHAAAWAVASALIAVKAMKFLADAVLGTLGAILGGAAKAFGWIPGLGPKLKTASTAFNSWKQGVDIGFNTTIGHINQKLAQLVGTPHVAKLRVDNSQAMSGIAATRAALTAINGRTAIVHIAAVYQAAGAAALGAFGGVKGIGNAPHHAGGGPSSGLTWVGERGPELLYTPPGSYVYNNAQSQRMGGGGNITINFNGVVGDPHRTAMEIQQMLLQLKRRRGFGQGNTSAGLGLA